MGTVLEKPVLLDETGQEIVLKLEDIKMAIGGTGEFTPINIRVTTPPIKTTYFVGEALDLTGIKVTLYGSNGGMYDITGDCTFSPTNGHTLTILDTEVQISYTWYKDETTFTAKQPLTINEVYTTDIEVTTPPTKTNFVLGESLDLSGMVVKATLTNGTQAVVTSSCSFSPQNGDILDDTEIDEVTITYYDSIIGRTFSTSQSISVVAPIYGVEWDGTATTLLSRTDLAENFTDPVPQLSDGNGGWTVGSSPFDNVSPWKDIKVVTVGSTKMVEIPKFYYKWTRESATMKLQISPVQLDGFLVSPAHANRKNSSNQDIGEKDVVYITKYKRTVRGDFGSGFEITSQSITDARTAAESGDGNYLMDYAMWWTINMLYLVEFANWDIRATIGIGNDTRDSNYKLYNGFSDQLTYHTGYTKSDKTTEGGASLYRHIENWYGGVEVWCDNVYSLRTSYDVYAYTGVGRSGSAVLIGSRGNYGCIRSFDATPETTGLEYALVPRGSGSDYTQYVTDNVTSNGYTSGENYLATGGNYINSPSYGAFYQKWQSATNVASWRRMKLPNNT